MKTMGLDVADNLFDNVMYFLNNLPDHHVNVYVYLK